MTLLYDGETYTNYVRDPSLKCIVNMGETSKAQYDYSDHFGVNSNLCRIYCSDEVDFILANKINATAGETFSYDIELAAYKSDTRSTNNLLSSVIKRFLKKCDLDYSSDVLNNIKFFYNSKELNEFDKTMELIFVNYKNISIHVFYRVDIIGAGPLIFVDVSRGKIREISSDQIVGNLLIGLNIIGICTNNNCDAKGKKVAYCLLHCLFCQKLNIDMAHNYCQPCEFYYRKYIKKEVDT